MALKNKKHYPQFNEHESILFIKPLYESWSQVASMNDELQSNSSQFHGSLDIQRTWPLAGFIYVYIKV